MKGNIRERRREERGKKGKNEEGSKYTNLLSFLTK